MKVIKNSGNIVSYDAKKLRRSLQRSGVSGQDLENIVSQVEAYLYDGIKTKQIYKFAHRLLKKVSSAHAARYNLRSALQQLGPAGFFFEKFVALLYAAEGYDTRTNLVLAGKCVTHEIDIVIRKSGVSSMVECKFHSRNESLSDVKVPMYILSRFNDLKDIPQPIFETPEYLSECRIATNNRFTGDAIAFAGCSGIKLLSWDYPANDCLKTKIDMYQRYPVTCLVTLAAIEKEKLLIMGIILVSQLIESPDSLQAIGISETRTKRIMTEALALCNNLIK